MNTTTAAIHRTETMSYPVPADATFAIRCDPPYESADGGSDETLTTTTRDDVHRVIADLTAANLNRLAIGQVPMIIEVSRIS